MAGRSSGRITRRRVAKLPCRRVSEHSSRLLSIWLKVASPARIETGMFRNTKQMMRMRPVPVSSIGGTLKATM